MHRRVMIDGQIYIDHELKEIDAHIGIHTVVRVDSGADGFELVQTFHVLPYEDGMTKARAESLTWALPEFVEYVDEGALLDEVLEILTDEQAEQVPDAFREWQQDTAYKVGDRRRYKSQLYKCVTAHTSQVGWEPDISPSLWSRIGEGDIPEWIQPTGAHDAYSIGDKVRHNKKVWISTINANTYEPGVYGWDEA